MKFMIVAAVAVSLVLSGCSSDEPAPSPVQVVDGERVPPPVSSDAVEPSFEGSGGHNHADEFGGEMEVPQDVIDRGCEFLQNYLTYNSRTVSVTDRVAQLSPFMPDGFDVAGWEKFISDVNFPQRSNLPGFFTESTATVIHGVSGHNSDGSLMVRCAMQVDAVLQYSGVTETIPHKALWVVQFDDGGKFFDVTEPAMN